MSLNAGSMQTWSKGRKTASANTAITTVIPGRAGKRAKLTKFQNTASTTAHTLIALTELNRTTLTADAAAAQAAIVLAADPGSYSTDTAHFPNGCSVADNLIATSDILVIRGPDGIFNYCPLHSSTAPVTNSDGTVTVTLASNVPTGGFKKGATVFWFGTTTDTNPHTGDPHQIFTLPASTVTTQDAGVSSLAETPLTGSPMLLYNANASNASTQEYANGVYGP